MTTPAAQVAAPTPGWPAALTLAERELVRFFRQRNRVFGGLGQPIIFWLLFSEGLRHNDLGYAHFFPGTLVMILLFTAIFSTISVIEDRREGFLQSVLVSPAPRWAMVAGKVLGGATIALLQALVFLALGWATMPLVSGAGDLVAAVILMGVLAVSLTALGFAIAWMMESTQGFHAIMSVFLLPMWLLSGAFFPAGGTGPLAWIVRANPLTYGVAGLRHYLRFAESTGEPASPVANLPALATCWVVTLAFAAALLALAWRVSRARTSGDLL